jgi:hypothetical protein
MDEETTPLTERETLIKDDGDQWDDFRDRVNMCDDEELAQIADRLGLGEQDDYASAFSGETWADFAEAYFHVMREEFQL